MKFKVSITHTAENDLFDIYKYVYLNESEEHAERLHLKLQTKCLSLENFPYRGHIPNELKLLGITDFYEITSKPYRIIYQIVKNSVYIHCVLDGRRDMQKLLQDKLLREHKPNQLQ